jgi:hypothetical protein
VIHPFARLVYVVGSATIGTASTADGLEEARGRAMDFAAELGRGITDLQPEDLRHDALTLVWGLSAWMRRCAAGLDEAWDGVALLRAALLDAGGLDPVTEPVPLRMGDPATALVNVAVYLSALAERAARCRRTDPGSIVQEAVGRLRS